MHFLKLAVAAIAAVIPAASAAGFASVFNFCTFPVYLKDQGMGGFQGPVLKLPANTGAYTEAFRGPGAAILLGKQTTLANPLTVEYSPSGSLVYYDLSNNAGNPFVSFSNSMIPSVTSCYKFQCGPNAPNCYSNGAAPKVKTCNVNTNLTVSLCVKK